MITKTDLQHLAEKYRDNKNISVFGVHKAARRAIFAALPYGGIYVETDYALAREAYEFIRGLRPNAIFLPARSDSIGNYAQKFGENDYERMTAIARIALGGTHVVTFVEAAMQLYPEKSGVLSAIITLRTGDKLEPQGLACRLANAGYRRAAVADERGEFSVRGDIVDVRPINRPPVRISFDFDEIGSIKNLNDELFTVSAADSAEIFPCSDSLDDTVHLCGFSDSGVFISDAKTVADSAALTRTEHVTRVAALVQSGDASPSAYGQIAEPKDAFAYPRSVTYHTGLSQNRLSKTDEVLKLTDENIPSFANDFSFLEAYVRARAESSIVRCFGGSASGAAHIAEFLRGKSIPCSASADFDISQSINERGADGATEPSGVIVYECGLSASFAFENETFIGTPQLITKLQRSAKKRKELMPVPEVGDYVVHDVHGIGKCLSIEKLNLTGAERDYVVIGYEGGDKLMLPVENLDSLSKFSYTDTVPALSHLGGAQFARAKERVKASIREMAIDLVNLYGARESGRGHVYAPEESAMDEFIAAFDYVDTPDQTDCTLDALNDLALGKIMDRLLCGDVGFGKTEVAMRVAYRVILEGKQVAFLCPTTILAYQHYNTVCRRMDRFGVKSAMLSRVTPAREVKEIISKLERGEIDIVIGTHKILSKSVKFRDLGLLILDEEQRFGVAHKETLKSLKSNVNALSMTATPIPRTLHMSLSGIRDISMLTTPPKSRLPVQTYVAEYSDGLLSDALMREKSRGGQSFVVYNRVEKIMQIASRVERAVGGKLSIGVVHGQMDSLLAEKVIEKFASGGTDVLIATTIIENGIDIPRANTMVVLESDKFGLSQMYQLRGRIGRSDRLASVYFTYDENSPLSESALHRLDAIMQYRELGSGYMLAMRDLELRGAGNILGAQQHGHMEQVGYETYMKLLAEVVGEVKGEPIRRKTEVRVKTDFNAFIPTDYIPSEEHRLRQYSRISRTSKLSELKTLLGELREIYGEPPKPVTNLLTVALVKNLASALGADEAVLKKHDGSLVYEKAISIPSDLAAAITSSGGSVLISSKAHLSFTKGTELVRFLSNYNG